MIFKRLFFLTFFLLPFFPAAAEAGDIPPALLGTWGQQILGHHNAGDTWHTEADKTTFNSNGTGIIEYKFNDNGVRTSGTDNFTYTLDSNADGSFTLWSTSQGETVAEPSRFILADDGKMIIGDGTDDSAGQETEILIKLDTTKTYTNADLSGTSYMIGYEHDAQGGDRGYFRASSHIGSSDGNGTISFTAGKLNGDGTLHDDVGAVPYTVNPDGSVVISGTGYLSDKLFIRSNPDSPGGGNDWENDFAMAQGDRDYTTADLGGTWAFCGFGDHEGTNFRAEIGTVTCDSAGGCTYSLKAHRSDGSVSYILATQTLSVAADGSFGLSLPGAISYAGAIGNDGNTIIINMSFDPDNLRDRDVLVAVKCAACSNLAATVLNNAEETAIRANFEDMVTASNNSDIGSFMSFVSENYMNDGKDKAAFQAEISADLGPSPLGYTMYSMTVNIAGDTATTVVDWAGDGTDTYHWLKETDGVWRVYGNQQSSALPVKGDLNGDGNVTLADAVMALKIVDGMDAPGVTLDGDVNNDGRIGMADGAYIIQYLAGLRN